MKQVKLLFWTVTLKDGDKWFCFSLKVVRSGDLISYCAEEGVRILGEGKFLVSDSFPGNERTKYCLTSKVYLNISLKLKF